MVFIFNIHDKRHLLKLKKIFLKIKHFRELNEFPNLEECTENKKNILPICKTNDKKVYKSFQLPPTHIPPTNASALPIID